jgi:nicotinate-nucleotide adenylyltransferase
MKGLLGGTFDPPHIGHLTLALEAASRFDLEEVMLVPSRYPPHKNPAALSAFPHRLRMTELAASTAPLLRAADLEPPDSPSWTVDLLRGLREAGEDICFIMGMDSLLELPSWREPHLLACCARLVAGTRPGFMDPSGIDPKLLSKVEVFPIPIIGVSSSDLRRRFALGLPTRYLVPDDLREYIEENRLYARSESD